MKKDRLWKIDFLQIAEQLNNMYSFLKMSVRGTNIEMCEEAYVLTVVFTYQKNGKLL